MFKSLIGFITLSMLAFNLGCSTISKEECEVGDWAGIGQRDASQGRTTQRYYDYVKECSEHGYKPNHDAYKQGYSEGLKTYCTAENGWNIGKSGQTYSKICPKNLARAFEISYKKGREIYTLNQKVRSIDTKISDIDTKLEETQTNMVSGNNTGAQVAMMGIQMEKMRKEQRDLRRQKEQLQAQLRELDGANTDLTE